MHYKYVDLFLWHPSGEGVCIGRVAVNVSTLVRHWPKVVYNIMSFIESLTVLKLVIVLSANVLCLLNLSDALQRFFFFLDLFSAL